MPNEDRQIKAQSADVAQLVEQLICNQQVAGSSPIVGSIEFNQSMYVSSRGGAAVARRAHNPKVVGSNPAPATKCDQTAELFFLYFHGVTCLVLKASE